MIYNKEIYKAYMVAISDAAMSKDSNAVVALVRAASVYRYGGDSIDSIEYVSHDHMLYEKEQQEIREFYMADGVPVELW